MLKQARPGSPEIQEEINFLNEIADLLKWPPDVRHVVIRLWSDGDYQVAIDSYREIISSRRNEACKVCDKIGLTALLPLVNVPLESQPACIYCVREYYAPKKRVWGE